MKKKYHVARKEERHLYNTCQWAWEMIGSVEDYKDLSDYVIDHLKSHGGNSVGKVLHLACGSGCMDFHMKRHIDITGVDLSENMLNSAAKKNPECRYVYGDMRFVRIKGRFDAVIIPESVDYMRSEKDMFDVFSNARGMLSPGGLLLVNVMYNPEHFPQNRTTVEQVDDPYTELTFIENNYAPDLSGDYFEATFVFLARQQGRLKTIIDVHTLGLFGKDVWIGQMERAGFDVQLAEDPRLERIEQKGAYTLIGVVPAD